MYDNLKYVYCPYHDQRYADVPPEQRHEYPDEVVDEETGKTIAIRKYTLKEIEFLQEAPWQLDTLSPGAQGVMSCFDINIYAKNVPMSKVLEDAKEVREFMMRVNRPMTDEQFERKRSEIEWLEQNIWNRPSR